MKKALFLDRDGVINVDHGYVGRIEDFELVGGTISLLHAAQARDFALIVVTNQSGIARGYFTEAAYSAVEAHMCQRLLDEGVVLTAVYHCPHHPDGTISAFAMRCSCRKPQPGMINRAVRDHGIDAGSSFLLGDKLTDLQAAEAAGLKQAFLVGDCEGRPIFAEVLAAINAA